jgi:hypothetical protein
MLLHRHLIIKFTGLVIHNNLLKTIKHYIYKKTKIMLYAKISPSAKAIHQSTPFTSVTTEADYMTVLARPYGAGATKVNFEILFGTITNNGPKGEQKFTSVTSSNMTLQGEELSQWGTNDEVVLQIVANKLNVSVLSYITIESKDRL